MQGREEAIRRASPARQTRSSPSRADLHRLSATETLVYALSFLRTQSLNKTAAALVKELDKQPWTAPGTEWRLSGAEADAEAGKCSGAELVSLVRAKLDMVKERCVLQSASAPQLDL